jgi:hypothetical protein
MRMAEIDKEKQEAAAEAIRKSKAEVEKDPDCFAGTRGDEIEAALDVHGTCVRALEDLDPEIRQQVLESVARFLIIPVEPCITEVANMGVQVLTRAFEAYKGGQHPADQQVTDGQGTENIVSLLSRLMQKFPEEKRQELRDYVVSLAQSCYGAGPAAAPSEASSSGPPSSEEPSSG